MSGGWGGNFHATRTEQKDIRHSLNVPESIYGKTTTTVRQFSRGIFHLMRTEQKDIWYSLHIPELTAGTNNLVVVVGWGEGGLSGH